MTYLKRILASAAVAVMAMGGSAFAATINVPGDFLTIQAAIDDVGTVNGDTILIAAGSHTESSVFITKELTIEGMGTGSTFLDGVRILYPKADNITIKNLTIHNSTTGVRFELKDGTIDNTEINNVHLVDNSSRGIEIHNATTVTDLRIIDSFFDHPGGIGIRLASTSHADGISITGTDFQNHFIAFYQANDNGTSTLRNLHVNNSTFTDDTVGVYAEEIQDSMIENSTFTRVGVGFNLFKAYESAGVDVKNITIQDNTFIDGSWEAVNFYNLGEFGNIDSPISNINILNNTMTQDIGVFTDGLGQISLRLDSDNATPHGLVTISGNQITYTGDSGVKNAYGIRLKGALDSYLITGNTIDGGNVGGAGGGSLAPTSGIYIATNDAAWGASSNTNINISGCNVITNFVNGVSVYDSLNATFGNLPAGADVNVNGNNIDANSALDVDNSGTSEDVDADGNYWNGAPMVSANVTTANPLAFPCDSDPTIVLIDIVPGSPINSINNDGKGVIPVAILGSTGFDVTTIIPESLSFDGMSVAVRGKDKILCHIADVNTDGYDDLVCLFEDEDGVLVEGSGTGTVTGNVTPDLSGFEGTDDINIVP